MVKLNFIQFKFIQFIKLEKQYALICRYFGKFKKRKKKN